MANTPQNPRMLCNSLAPLTLLYTRPFGRFGRRQKSSSLLGLQIKIEFGWPIAWRSVDGLIVAYALFASNVLRPSITFLSSAISALVFGA
jgi:hypothetical protein